MGDGELTMDEAKARVLNGLAELGWPHPEEDSNDDAIALKWGEFKPGPWLTAQIRRAHFPGEAALGSHYVAMQFSGDRASGSIGQHGSIDEVMTAIDQFRFVICGRAEGELSERYLPMAALKNTGAPTAFDNDPNPAPPRADRSLWGYRGTLPGSGHDGSLADEFIPVSMSVQTASYDGEPIAPGERELIIGERPEAIYLNVKQAECLLAELPMIIAAMKGR